MPDYEGEACGVKTLKVGSTRLRLRARRCRAWFNELSRDQRSLMELVIVVVKEKVRSLVLAKLIVPIVKKLLDAMGGIQVLIGEVAYKMGTVGLRLAQKLSQSPSHKHRNRHAHFHKEHSGSAH